MVRSKGKLRELHRALLSLFRLITDSHSGPFHGLEREIILYPFTITCDITCSYNDSGKFNLTAVIFIDIVCTPTTSGVARNKENTRNLILKVYEEENTQ